MIIPIIFVVNSINPLFSYNKTSIYRYMFLAMVKFAFYIRAREITLH